MTSQVHLDNAAKVLEVFKAHPGVCITEKRLRHLTGVSRPLYEAIYALKRCYDIESIKGPGGGFRWTPPAAIAVLPALSRGPRASGRTYRQLEALPDGGVYIIAGMSAVWYFRDQLAKMGRPRDAVHFVSLQNPWLWEQLRGVKALDMDHFAQEIATKSQIVAFWAAKR